MYVPVPGVHHFIALLNETGSPAGQIVGWAFNKMQ